MLLAIHSASWTSLLCASHGFDVLRIRYHQLKEAFQTPIHLHPVDSRALHGYVAASFLQEPGS
jgi:hypothetical protein